MKKNDWVLCPLTKDDIDKPTIVARIAAITDIDDYLLIAADGGTIPIPKNWCRVVYVQGILEPPTAAS